MDALRIILTSLRMTACASRFGDVRRMRILFVFLMALAASDLRVSGSDDLLSLFVTARTNLISGVLRYECKTASQN